MYNPGAFQTAASAQGLYTNDIVRWPFESGISVSFSLLTLSELSPFIFKVTGVNPFLFSKPDVTGIHLPHAGPQSRGCPL